MHTYAFMIVLVTFIVVSAVYGIQIDKAKDSFMSLNDTNFLRGFWCIIVVLVHIPADYQNRIQDMIGSFAYIGVTFFFMTSAYGLKYSILYKNGYMEHFWRRRLPVILIPALIVNVFYVVIHMLESGSREISIISFLNINNWVKVLLLYYLAFWIIYYIAPKFIVEGEWQDIVICLFVVLCSMIDRLTDLKVTSIWIVEPLGFAYGIIAATYSDSIKRWMKEKYLLKCVIFMFLSGFLGIVYLKLKHIDILGDYLLKIALGIVIITFIFEVISKLRVGNKLSNFLGNISYEIYLLHGGVFALIAMIDKNMNSGVFVVSAVMITVALAYVLNRACRSVVKLFR